MRTVFEANHVVEAHMVRDLLRQEGIVAHIHGEHLQGALGELPAAGLVRLVVAEEDHPRARDVIDRWEVAQPKDLPLHVAPARPRLVLGLGLGMVGGLALSWAFFHHAMPAKGMDHNGDGQIDERWYANPTGMPLRSEIDRNFDGRVDAIVRHDPRGLPDAGETDDDFDGVFEGHTTYRQGQVGTQSQDTDADGVHDQVTVYRHGVPVTTDFLDPATRRPLRVEHYRLGRLVRAEVDTDRDGELDTEQEYGPLAELRSVRRLPRNTSP